VATIEQVFYGVNAAAMQQMPSDRRLMVAMSTLVTGTRSLLPTLLLVAVASVLVLLVLPAVLLAAGGTAT
jgi:hypothetical protein